LARNPSEFLRAKYIKENSKTLLHEKKSPWLELANAVVKNTENVSVIIYSICEARAMEEYSRIKLAAKRNKMEIYDVFREVKYLIE
jgi:hypothetical protein